MGRRGGGRRHCGRSVVPATLIHEEVSAEDNTRGVDMDDRESEEEWLEDFGAPHLTEAELAGLVDRARRENDVDLRRSLKELRVWRMVGPELLDRIVPRGSSIDQSDQLLKFARFFIRGEGAAGS